MFNYKMIISYDGTDFCGFQFQNNLRTVQGELMENIKRVTGEDVTIIGSGRTDTGVHARGQVVNFFLEREFEEDKILRSLNSVLPIDIRVLKIEQVSSDFSARFSALQKTYSYTIAVGGILSPFLARYCAYCKTPLDIPKMKEGATALVGEHNFKSFCKAKSEVKGYVKTLLAIDILDEVIDGQYIIKLMVTGKSFLHNMVRIIATCLINCGTGKFSKQDIEDILKEEKRTAKVITAEPQGLCLEEVTY